MIKEFVLLLSFLSFNIFSWFGQPALTVNMNLPEEVNAGQEFTVKISINKGDVESFSRFTLDLPYGLTANRVNAANADFTFENQRVRMIWLKLPPGEEINASFKVMVHPRLKGSFKLNGEFSYIVDNERKSIPVPGAEDINIIPDPELAATDLVDIKDFEKVILPEILKAKENQVTAIRMRPEKTGTHEISVELEINKQDLNKFAKIEDFVPEGFRAVEGDSKGGIFSYSDGMIKILWMNLPKDDKFKVSYKLIPDPGKTIDDLKVSGSFSYIADNQTKTIAIVEKNYDLAQNTAINDTEETANTTGENVVDTRVKKDGDHVSGDESTQNTEQQKPDNPYTLQAENGIYYRVQLAAGHSSVDIERYFHRKKVSDDVKMEFHEGWRKYTVGSFYVYKDARDYRVKIWDNTPIDDAFVAAYNNGERITVQEALLIANHKWYR